MSLHLYLDDCAFSHELRRLLREAGHDVEVPVDIDPPLTGGDDAVHLDRARTAGRVLLTMNPRDFKALHDLDSNHHGILAVYQDNNPAKDMSYAEIVRAVANLEQVVGNIAGGFWVLNVFRW